MNNFKRLFGAGPRGLLISIALLIIAYFVEPVLGLPQIHNSKILGALFFGFSIVLTILLIIWSAKSLNPDQRGRELITSGAFKYFRHPLYAAFLNFFNFGFAFFCDNYVFIIWAILQHPVWHVNVVSEEKMVKKLFPVDYDQYCKKTGRFIPRFWRRLLWV